MTTKPKLIHKTGYLSSAFYCGQGVSRDEAATNRWAGVNCLACRRAVLDRLGTMAPGPEKDALIDELIGLKWKAADLE